MVRRGDGERAIEGRLEKRGVHTPSAVAPPSLAGEGRVTAAVARTTHSRETLLPCISVHHAR